MSHEDDLHKDIREAWATLNKWGFAQDLPEAERVRALARHIDIALTLKDGDIEELKAAKQEAEDKLAEAIFTKEHTQYWYAVRLERIKDSAKAHGIWPEIAAIIANGTANAFEPPTYAQQLNRAIHRAEAAEACVKTQNATILTQANALQEAMKALEHIIDGYANQDINHEDYRVGAYMAAMKATGRL
jgi:hypothetical protein